jgi:hypothetical protein
VEFVAPANVYNKKQAPTRGPLMDKYIHEAFLNGTYLMAIISERTVCMSTDCHMGNCSQAVELQLNNNNSSVALVRERTIPIYRLPLVGKVSANFCG